MIIDIHWHFPERPLSENALNETAQRSGRYYGSGGRSGLKITAAEILENLRKIAAPDPDGSKLIGRMDEAGIDLTVALVVDRWTTFADEADVLEANKACADFVKHQPDRLMAFAGIDPRRKDAPGILKRCIEDYGMKGLKLHPDQGYYLNTPESYALLGAAQDLGVPVLTHTGPLPPLWHSKFTHPSFLDDVCLDFPDLKVVAAHMGRNWWPEWAGLAQFRHNLFGDLAMWQYAAVGNYPRFCRLLRDIMDWCGAEAVLFASDGPNIEALVPNKEFIRLVRELPVKAPPGIVFTDAEVEAILCGNAKKVLGL